MKIVEAKPFEYAFTCVCGSKLVAEAEDVRFGDFGSAAFDTTRLSFYVTCPVCNRDRLLKFCDVPPSVERMARKKGSTS